MTRHFSLAPIAAAAFLCGMAFLHVNKPGGADFYVFPTDPDSVQGKTAQEFLRVVTLASIERALAPRTVSQLKTRVGQGRMSVVGLWPEDAALKKWEKIIGGETIFFVTKTQLVGSAVIVHSERSRTLAEQLFGRGAGLCELLILLVDATPLAMPLAKFNEALGRKGGSSFKNLASLSAEQVRRMEEQYGSVYGFIEAAKPAAS